MWSNPSKNPKVNKGVTKERINLSVDKNLYEQFRTFAQQDRRKYSNIVEGYIHRHMQSRL